MNTAKLLSKKIFIAEDSASIRARLIDMLDKINGVSIVGSAETPSDAVQGIRATHPDFVVLDFQLLGGTAVEVLKECSDDMLGTVFIMLTNHPNSQYRRLCMSFGAHYFFDKSEEFTRVKDVIEAAIPTSAKH